MVCCASCCLFVCLFVGRSFVEVTKFEPTPLPLFLEGIVIVLFIITAQYGSMKALPDHNRIFIHFMTIGLYSS